MGMRLVCLIGVVVAISLAACGGEDGSADSPERRGSASEREKQASTTTAPPEAPQQPHGLVVFECAGGPAVTFLDPDTGEETETRRFEIPDDYGFVACSIATQEASRIRQQVDPSFEHLALGFEDPSDGSSHVGFLNYQSGEFTDVTAEIVQRDDFSDAPQHRFPAFHPSTGALLFLDERSSGESVVRSYDLGSGAVEEVVTGFFSGGFVATELAVSGIDEYGDYAFANPSATLSAYRTGEGLGVGAYGVDSGSSTIELDGPCFPTAWLDDQRLVCIGVAGIFLVPLELPTGNPADGVEGQPIQLAPATTDRQNAYATPAPDEQRFAFVSTQGATTEIFVGSLAGTGEIRSIATVNPSDVLIGWV